MLALTCLCAILSLAGAVDEVSDSKDIRTGRLLASRGQQPGGVISIHERILQSGQADCLWDGAKCSLRRDFINDLPGLLGSPTTDSAKILAGAALRAAVCSNFTGQPECLAAAASWDCDWDSALNRCTLADILNATGLRGVAYCPGSGLDAAMSCFTLGPSACNSASSAEGANCTLVDATGLMAAATGGVTGLGASLGDLQLSKVLGSMLGTMVKYGLAGLADPLRQGITLLLQLASGFSSASGSSIPQVCVASWMVDSVSMSAVADAVVKALQTNQDLLTALLSSSSLTGTCNGTVPPFLAAARECVAASSSASACAAAASGRCRWVTSTGGVAMCSVGPSLLPSLTLDPSDRWVAVLNNVTAICSSFTNASSCGAAVDMSGALQGGGVGGGGNDGGGAATAALGSTWWLLVAVTALVAVALGHSLVV